MTLKLRLFSQSGKFFFPGKPKQVPYPAYAGIFFCYTSVFFQYSKNSKISLIKGEGVP